MNPERRIKAHLTHFFPFFLLLYYVTQYVDENYQGGGTGEYSYYDPYKQSWDDTACNKHGNGRCAPMDCHLTNTSTWTLMGVFKEASYFGNDAFFEQLFKHQGVCLWNDDDTYSFMSSARQSSWTQGCVATGIQGDSYYFDNYYNDGSNYLYLDLKPTWNGNMTYGLYTDSSCKTEYEGLDVDVDKVSKTMGLLYGSYLQEWNEGLEIFKVCQPCKTSNLGNTYSTSSYSENVDEYYYYNGDPNDGYFQCDDDAGYTNVNQCMKFRTHAELEVATWEDLVTATNQGGILEVDVGGTVFGSERMSAEEAAYLQSARRSELAAEAKEAQRQALYARQASEREKELERQEKTEMERWKLTGSLVAGLGAFTLLLSLFRVYSNNCRRRRSRDFSEPLIYR